MLRLIFCYCLLLLLLLSCKTKTAPPVGAVHEDTTQQATTPLVEPLKTPEKSVVEKQFEAWGLVNVQDLEPTMQVELKYATEDNFLGEKLYDGIERAYLQPDVAEMLMSAHVELTRLHPGYTFLIYDAARPLSVQAKMFAKVAGTAQNIYVSSPQRPGLHNYGAAVDLTILDETGTPLDMGTPFDFFGEEAEPRAEDRLLNKGVLTQQQITNRRLLRGVMTQAGFTTLPQEWWHFNACNRATAKQRYRLID